MTTTAETHYAIRYYWAGEVFVRGAFETREEAERAAERLQRRWEAENGLFVRNEVVHVVVTVPSRGGP